MSSPAMNMIAGNETAAGRFGGAKTGKIPSTNIDILYFSIPKIIRIYFLFDRGLLKELSRIAWEVLGLYYKNSVSNEGVALAAICFYTDIW